MLSLFPSFLSYQELSPFLIRLVLGLTIMYFGYRHIKGDYQNNIKILGWVEVILALSILAGIYTQLSALLIAILMTVKLILKIISKKFLTDGINYYLLLLVMAISLLVTGAGWFAFDMPL